VKILYAIMLRNDRYSNAVTSVKRASPSFSLARAQKQFCANESCVQTFVVVYCWGGLRLGVTLIPS